LITFYTRRAQELRRAAIRDALRGVWKWVANIFRFKS
jgi:hypothetical protein